MDKIILRGILCLITILAFSAMAFGQTAGHGAAHPAPPPPGVGGPAGYSGPDGAGHGKVGGHGMMMGRHGAGGRMMDECPMMGKGTMGGPGMMGAPGGRMMEVEHHLARLLETLNLNEQQKKEVGEITTGMKKDTIRSVANIGIARLDLQELLGGLGHGLMVRRRNLHRSQTRTGLNQVHHIHIGGPEGQMNQLLVPV